MLIHAALVAWLVWAALCPAAWPAPEAERQVEVVLLPPSEDSAFPGPEAGRAQPRRRAHRRPRRRGQIAGADIDRIGGHLFVLFPFVTPGLALDAFFPSIPSSSRLVFENPYAPKRGEGGAAAGPAASP